MGMTPEERKAKDAERKRLRRAELRAERPAVPSRTVDAADASVPRVMRDAVEASLAAMKWLTPSDAGAVAQARMLAEQVDLLTAAGATTKLLSAHGRLAATLGSLAGTPTMRMQHELRSLRAAGKTDEEGDADDDDSEQPDNVTALPRPRARRPA
ncbi:hypothetical protein [Frigoribacterium sp. PhB107]|uniref:terminase small subunit n=1 Tax=Frigoribacterium sp. PhB107 TaxID=2485172 RepID=UPI000F47A91C|nr:hypothetical protein [Frigoribacterium sp. PhB107]